LPMTCASGWSGGARIGSGAGTRLDAAPLRAVGRGEVPRCQSPDATPVFNQDVTLRLQTSNSAMARPSLAPPRDSFLPGGASVLTSRLGVPSFNIQVPRPAPASNLKLKTSNSATARRSLAPPDFGAVPRCGPRGTCQPVNLPRTAPSGWVAARARSTDSPPTG